MASIISNNSFTNCKKLKKIYLNPETIIGALDLSKTLIRNYQVPEKYDKSTGDNAIFAANRVIHNTKFPPKDASVGTDLTSEEITKLEEKLTKALADTSSSGLKIGELFNKIIKFNEKTEYQKLKLEKAKKQKEEFQKKIDSINTELNSSQVDKLSLENQVKELNEELEKIKTNNVLDNVLDANERTDVKHLKNFFDIPNWSNVDIKYLTMKHGPHEYQDVIDKFLELVINATKELSISTVANPILGKTHNLLIIISNFFYIVKKYQRDLAKEKGWWDKWINDGQNFITSNDGKRDYFVRADFPSGKKLVLANVYYLDKGYALQKNIIDMLSLVSSDSDSETELAINPTKFTFADKSFDRNNIKKFIKEEAYKYYLDK